MKGFLNKFKIPTLLGLFIILFGIGAAVSLTLRDQIFISKASPDEKAQNIVVSNISDSSVNISWQTSQSSASFVTFGINSPNEETVLDDRDSESPKAHIMHYVTLKNLLPKTSYLYKIVSGRVSSEVGKFTTSSPISSQMGYRPIIGTVLDGDKPLDEGIVYLSIAGAITESSQVKDSGNFLIPISQIRKSDLSDIFTLSEETTVKLTVISPKGESNALFKLKDAYDKLPPIKLGENLEITPTPSPIISYDLNDDGKINATDNAILLQNFGNPSASSGLKNKKADLNSDGVIDQKDLDLMSKQINQ